MPAAPQDAEGMVLSIASPRRGRPGRTAGGRRRALCGRRALDWEKIIPAGRVAPLPTYPWQRERCWYEAPKVGRKRDSIPNRDSAVPVATVTPHEPTAEDKWLVRPTWEPIAAPTATERLSGTWLVIADDAAHGRPTDLLAPRSRGSPGRRGVDRPRILRRRPDRFIGPRSAAGSALGASRRAVADRPGGRIAPGGGRRPCADALSGERSPPPRTRGRQRAAPGPGSDRQCADARESGS